MSMEYDFTIPVDALIPINGVIVPIDSSNAATGYTGAYVDQHYDIAFDVDNTEVGSTTGPTAYLYDKDGVKIEPSLEYFFGIRILMLFNMKVSDGLWSAVDESYGGALKYNVLKPGNNSTEKTNRAMTIAYTDVIQDNILFKYNKELSTQYSITDAFENESIMKHFIDKPEWLDIPNGDSTYGESEAIASEKTDTPLKGYFANSSYTTFGGWTSLRGSQLDYDYNESTKTYGDDANITFTFTIESNTYDYKGIKIPELYQVYAYYGAPFKYPWCTSGVVFLVEPMIYTHDESGKIIPVE